MIDIIGVQLDLGASKKGVNMGPGAVRFAGLTDMLDAEGISWALWRSLSLLVSY